MTKSFSDSSMDRQDISMSFDNISKSRILSRGKISSGQRYFTIAEVARLFGRHRSWVYRKIKEGVLPARKHQGTVTMIPMEVIGRNFDVPQKESNFRDVIRESYQMQKGK